jgi:glycerophosphoryl diester phosphodiesterase
METDSSIIENLYAGSLSQGEDRIPYFHEVFDWVASLPKNDRPKIQVELKSAGAGKAVGELTLDYLEQNKFELENLLVISFNRDELLIFKDLCPTVNLAILGGCVYRNVLIKKVPCFSPDRYDELFVYHRENFLILQYQAFREYKDLITSDLICDDEQRKELTQMIADIFDGSCYTDDFIEFAHSLGVYSINMWHRSLFKDMVDKVHALGMKVCVYTVDEKEDLLHMRDIGVDGVVTNYYRQSKQIYDQGKL